MPSLGPTRIRAPTLKMGGFLGMPQILNGVKMAGLNVWQGWIDHMVNWLNAYAPYRSGVLLFRALCVVLESEPNRMYIGADVPYATYVNDYDPPINWTNPQTPYHFYDKEWEYAKRILKPLWIQAVRELGLHKGSNFTATELVEEYLG